MATPRSLILLFFSCMFFTSCAEQIILQLQQGQQLRDWEHLLSPKGTFKLGFFNPSSSSNRYLGIWYSKLPHNPDAVWVANPNNPIYNSSGVLNLDSDGRLKISQNGGETIVVSSIEPVKTPVMLTLLDTGNLLLSKVSADGNPGQVLWQSFDYPSNTLLPGMKLGMNLKTGHNWTLTSWLSDRDPSPGAFRLGVDIGNLNELVVWRRDEVYWTSGVWEEGKFKLAPELAQEEESLYEFSFVSNDDEKYFSFSVKNNSTISRWEINLWGEIVQSTLAPDNTTWKYQATSSCNLNGNYTDAVCIDQKPSKCRNGSELFVQQRGYYESMDLLYIEHNSSLTISDCHSMCWNNCSCIAFQSLSADGTGCELWDKGGKFVSNDNFDVIYVLALQKDQGSGTLPGEDKGHASGTKRLWWVWCIAAAALALTVLLLGYMLYSRRRMKLLQQSGERKAEQTSRLKQFQSQPSNKFGDPVELKHGNRKTEEFQMYSFSQLEAAAANFSTLNMLGKGGFGPVYRGVLPKGQEVAIKRLAKNSGQGQEEFMNEITLIAELQHTNLVKLLGCCIQGEEKMLIYEYMRNKSLDSFLFDLNKKELLDWTRRLKIIEGVAQGLLYLHKYSRLKVIHRDLKASNILLDDDMNPKISDFGMARIFGQNESRANTRRVVGTYGYMSPEYAMKGIFSVKSDVFSFGVLLLEIISGRKNTDFTVSGAPVGLIEMAWDLWNQDSIEELKDPSLGSCCQKSEFLRMVHIGFLCVQEFANDRPTMSEVISMLTNDSMPLPDLKQPAYCIGKSDTGEYSNGKSNPYSVNCVSITVMDAR